MKNKNKNRILIIIVVVVIISILVVWGFLNRNNSYEIEIIKDNTCRDIAKKYYSDDNVTVYSYCLDSIKIKVDNEKYELKDYLSNHSDGISYLISRLDYIETYKDVGTKLYRGSQKVSNQGLTVIACNSIIDIDKINNDIYIGPIDMDYKDYFCK